MKQETMLRKLITFYRSKFSPPVLWNSDPGGRSTPRFLKPEFWPKYLWKCEER